MLKAFFNGNKRHYKTGKRHVKRHVFLRVLKRLVGLENQLTGALINQVGNNARDSRSHYPTAHNAAHFAPGNGVHAHANGGKTDNGTNNGMGGRYRPAQVRRYAQPDPGGKQRGNHTQYQVFGNINKISGIDNTFTNG